ncbi:ribonuclease H-like protein [Penicillium sp. IBT 18751x]|nr:ribonuclease H-like protein [Penicillium sp. IBT 18751x]
MPRSMAEKARQKRKSKMRIWPAATQAASTTLAPLVCATHSILSLVLIEAVRKIPSPPTNSVLSHEPSNPTNHGTVTTSNSSMVMSNMSPDTRANIAAQMMTLGYLSQPYGSSPDYSHEDHELPEGHSCPLTYSPPGPSGLENQPTTATRLFNPEHFYPGQTSTSIQIAVGQFMFLACPVTPPCRHGHFAPHMEVPVISIHGSCSGDGTDTAHGAIGVWFGESPKNLRQPLDGLERCTSQIANLYAVIAALSHVAHNLEKWSRNRSNGHEKVPSMLHTVIIKTDSDFVMNVTDLLEKWKSQDWKRGNGKLIANQKLWKQIDDYLVYLEGKGKIRVRFWKVDASQNELAVNLAAHALRYPPMKKELNALMRRWNYPFI